MAKAARKGLMAQVLGRMSSSEVLINNRHAQSMLVGLLQEAEQVEDPDQAWAGVRAEVISSWGGWDDGPEGPAKPFIYNDGIAYIPIHGILLNRFPYCWGFVTGYDFIQRQLSAAEEDPDVKLVVYDVDSPGGEAAGCDETAREVKAGTKPSIAVVNSLAASGGYWAIAGADRIVCAPSGSVGSIGVYIMHMNFAKMLAEEGIEVEFIKEGKFKVSGNAFEQMTEEDRQYLQSMVSERYGEFCAAVAEFRGIEESVVKDTEARVMRPTEAIALGLIDAAVRPSEAVGDFILELGESEQAPIETEEEAMAEMTSEDRAAVANETKARIKGIVTHDEAKGREGLAEHLAYNTDLSVDDAVAMLKVAPKVEEQAPEETETETETATETETETGDDGEQAGKPKNKSQFEQAMDDGEHPNAGSGSPAGEGGDRVAAILAAQSLMTGRKTKD